MSYTLPVQPGVDGEPGRDGRKGAAGYDGRPGLPGTPGLKGGPLALIITCHSFTAEQQDTFQ